ncbi:hypothetical protein [Dongia deserti]|uniref:hypothetical protein n=1 Tax=Dongia deserti TaxID=2268030 RepID=UPI0013C4BF3A|nr:hypothetical protein [Dongia deserti]
MRRKTALAFGIGASLMLAAGTASANCASEVWDLQQQIGMQSNIQQPDANPATDFARGSSTMSPSGDTENYGTSTGTPEGTASSNAPIGSTELSAVDQGPDATPATDFTRGSSTMSPSGDPDGVGTSTGLAATGNPAAQVKSDPTVTGRVGTGTITETTRAGTLSEEPDSRSVALASLRKAEIYANAGQEEACMAELSIAKQHMAVE